MESHFHCKTKVLWSSLREGYNLSFFPLSASGCIGLWAVAIWACTNSTTITLKYYMCCDSVDITSSTCFQDEVDYLFCSVIVVIGNYESTFYAKFPVSKQDGEPF